MPTFLDNSLSGLNRGWQQLYGQQAERGARPQGQLFQPAPVAQNQPTPVAQNPAMGAPAGAQLNWERRGGTGHNEYHSAQGPSGTQYTVFNHPNRGWSVRMAQGGEYGPGLGPTHTLHGYSDRNTAMGVAHHTENVHGGRNPGLGAPISGNPEVGQPVGADNSTPAQQDSPLTDYYSLLFGLPYIRRMAANEAMPIARNPEMGQTLGADSGSDSSGAGLLSQGTNPLQTFFQNLTHLFSGGSSPQYSGPVSTNAPVLNADTQVGPPTPTTPQVPQTTGGVATDSASMDAANAANTSWGGGGGMSGGQMASSAIGAIGSGISNIGKNISSTKATYTAPNIPLPTRVVFTPPTLAPNRNASF